MEANSGPRVVLVHDWLTGMRGGEKCLEVLCRRWPGASLYTLFHKRGAVSPAIERLEPRSSLLGLLPGVHRYYRYLLPLMPLAVDHLRLPPCDLVVSFSHAVAKGVRPPLASGSEGVPHVCYCFTPMRYAWHMRQAYFSGRDGLKGRVRDLLLARVREWDRATAGRVSHFLAISDTVRQRIRECYDRDSTVIYPPVDTDFYRPTGRPREDFYLVVSAFAPYKRLDLAIAACNALGRPLVIIGTGQDEARLRALAGPTVRFLGWQGDEGIREMMTRCRALLFPGEEDFGIVPVEAQACGTPVLAFGRGGATETTVPLGRRAEPTALWFESQTPECLAEAILTFEKREGDFTPEACRRSALRFTAERYERELFAFLDGVLGARAGRRAA
jgi:glycosyltransferase involved in cell wall biosynthesis